MYVARHGKLIIAIGDDIQWILDYCRNFAQVNQCTIIIHSGDNQEPIMKIKG